MADGDRAGHKHLGLYEAEKRHRITRGPWKTRPVKEPQEMKTKLTLTIDEDLIPQAKRYAEARRDSLSGLVEKALQDLTQTQEMPFSKRWRGKFKASRRASTRYKALSRRYL